MSSIPILNRLSFRDYETLALTILFFFAELMARVVFMLLPNFVVNSLESLFKSIFPSAYRSHHQPQIPQLESATNMEALVNYWKYPLESHVIRTADSYLLTAFRIPSGRNEDSTSRQPIGSLIPSNATTLSSNPSSPSSAPSPPPSPPSSSHSSAYTGKPVVLLYHGFMMCSEVWVCNVKENANLPFILANAGYDVWLGNARGNKYSQKHMWRKPADYNFWEFSLDELALYDLPDTVNYILSVTGAPSLTYIGFSQGTAQAFASLSINPRLNDQINLFVALAPATRPGGLQNPMVDALVKATPNILYLILGRRAPLAMTFFWQQVLDRGLYMRVIDTACNFLFGWHGKNMSENQKLVSYQHLYSLTSVKTLVHWFQIIRSSTFQMYDEQPSRLPYKRDPSLSSVPIPFPTRQIRSPIAIFYGGSDSLVDFDVMKSELPRLAYQKKIAPWEHLDFLWADGIEKIVYPDVLSLLEEYNPSNYHPPPIRNFYSRLHYSQSRPEQMGFEANDDSDTSVNGHAMEEYEILNN